MTAPLRGDAAHTPARALGPRRIRAHERARLLAWLDDGLRRGERGRLEAEYPVSLSARDLRGHRAVFADGRPVAHAMLHAAEVRARGGSLRVGLIGNVYTAPEWRGRGLAQRCVEACLADASARGLAIALLWSELRDFYARLGFAPAGEERRIALSGDVLARAAGGARELDVGAPTAADFATLEALYAAKPVHVVRAAGALARLARAPETTLLVARRGRTPLAYAACGRGDDLHGVVHEWAGDADGVLACAAAMAARCGAELLLAGAEPEPAAERLIAAGATWARTPLALARVLDAEALALATGERELAAWPLYLWGFDSI